MKLSIINIVLSVDSDENLFFITLEPLFISRLFVLLGMTMTLCRYHNNNKGKISWQFKQKKKKKKYR